MEYTDLSRLRSSGLQCCVWAGPTCVMTSTELWVSMFPPSSRLKVSMGVDWAVCGVALTNITFSSDPTIPQLFATLTAVRMLSPAWRGTNQDLILMTLSWHLQFQKRKRAVLLRCGLCKYKTFLTSDHDVAKMCLSQDVNNFGALWLHQVLHHH